eukprot:1369988-Prymnesium_polylepis.1
MMWNEFSRSRRTRECLSPRESSITAVGISSATCGRHAARRHSADCAGRAAGPRASAGTEHGRWRAWASGVRRARRGRG